MNMRTMSRGRSAARRLAAVLCFAAFAVLSGCGAGTASSGSVTAPTSRAAPQEPLFTGPDYVLKFSPGFNPGLNGVDDLGISIVIALDTSGSMSSAPAKGGESKLAQAAAALASIIDFLENEKSSPAFEHFILKTGIISFNEKVSDVYPLTGMNGPEFSRLKDLLGNSVTFRSSGSTAIGSAIERGAEMLAQSGTVLRSLVVISDGENTTGVSPEQVLHAVNENRNSASTRDYPVLTRGILTSFVGFDIDSGRFTPLANEGAKVTDAADGTELEAVLRNFISADIRMLEAAQ